MDKWLTPDEGIKLIEFIEIAESGRIAQDIYSSIDGAVQEAKIKLKNSQLGKIVENCPSIPANRKLLFIVDLYKIIDMYGLNKRNKDIDTIHSDAEAAYVKQLKKEVVVIEKAKQKQTDHETIENLNRIIETKNAWIRKLAASLPKKHRPVDILKHGLALSFKSVWNAHTNSEKMDDAFYDLAAQFFCELGYNKKSEQKYKGQEVLDNYDQKYMTEMFGDIEKAEKATPFYQRIN